MTAAPTFDRTVLQVIPALDAGGAERTTVEIARAVVEAGGRALVATSGGRLCAEAEAAGAAVFRLPVASKNPLVMAANRRALVKMIVEQKVDIIHARSRAPGWSALWAARAAGIPFVATYHGAYRTDNPLKRFYNSAMARADLVIANSAFTAAAIREVYGVGEDRLRIIPRGADLARFDPQSVSETRINAVAGAWGVNRNAGGLLFLLPGRLTEWKGHRVAIEAVARMARADATGGLSGLGAGFKLVFAGDSQGRDGYRASLLREIEELGLDRVISLVGHCDDMPAAYCLADAVLSPSTRPEAFGRVAVEAGAMGKAAIAAGHGGARETVIDGQTGLLVPPADAAALEAAFARVAGLGSEGRKAMGARARARIEEKFSTAAMAAATIEGYKELSAMRVSRLARGAV